MDDKFELTESQKEFILKRMGISDISDLRMIFEVDSIQTESIIDDFSGKSSKYSISMCYCGNGKWSPDCCG